MKTTTPTVLLPYQQRWIADKSPVKVIEKSRRIGISWAEAADCALTAAAKSGQDTWYLGYNQEMSQEFINDVAFWAKNYQLSATESEQFVLKDQDKDILAYRVRFASGKRVTALSSRPSNLRGKQGRVVIDEAAFHEDFPELMKAAIALLMWGGRVHIISTHDGVDNPFNCLIGDIRAGRKNYSLHRVSIDDAIADGLVQRICLKLGQKWSPEFEINWRTELFEAYGEDADEELLCIPSRSNRIYLPATLVESRMIEGKVLRFALPDCFTDLDEFTQNSQIKEWLNQELSPELIRLPKNLKSFYGMDFGRSGDMSAIAVLIEESNLQRKCPLVIELRNVPFKEQELIVKHLIENLERFSGAAHDARGNGQYISEAIRRKYGKKIQSVMLSDNWYSENFPKYKAALEDRSLLLLKDSDILDDHRAIRVERGIPKIPANTRYKGTDGAYRHGDTAIALVLAHFAASSRSKRGLAFGSLPQPQTPYPSHQYHRLTYYR